MQRSVVSVCSTWWMWCWSGFFFVVRCAAWTELYSVQHIEKVRQTSTNMCASWHNAWTQPSSDCVDKYTRATTTTTAINEDDNTNSHTDKQQQTKNTCLPSLFTASFGEHTAASCVYVWAKIVCICMFIIFTYVRLFKQLLSQCWTKYNLYISLR